MKTRKVSAVAASIISAIAMPLSLAACGANATPENTDPYDIPQDYCRTYYEVFVRSFADGNNDGIGDFKGLTANLDHLNDGNDRTTTDLGINGIWMMPINKSASYHKYDVVDYYDVDPEYGTMADFEALVKACDDRGIWLQMDLVLNHTSDKNAWFLAALDAARAGADPEADPAMSKYIFVRSSTKPAGKYHRACDGYWYFANFSPSMPDLNLSNPAVKAEIENIVDFWLKKGIRSFRLDAVPSAFGDSNNASYSEPNGEFWSWFNGVCHEKGREVYGEKYPGLDVYCYNVGEVLTNSNAEAIKSYFGTGMSCFSFTYGATASNGYAALAKNEANGSGVVSAISAMQADVLSRDPHAILSNLLTNHDQDRAAGYCATEAPVIKTAAALYLLSPGNPYIYYGEELGAVGRRLANETDANRRLPFNWGDPTKGICNDPPEADFAGEQPFGTWKSQTSDADSILTFYRSAIKLRNRFPEIGRGIITPYVVGEGDKLIARSEAGSTAPIVLNPLNKPIAAYKLTWKDRSLLIVHNVGEESVSLGASGELVGSLNALDGKVKLDNGALEMPARSVAVIRL